MGMDLQTQRRRRYCETTMNTPVSSYNMCTESGRTMPGTCSAGGGSASSSRFLGLRGSWARTLSTSKGAAPVPLNELTVARTYSSADMVRRNYM